MSDVRLKVGGRFYTLACGDGEEERVRELAARVDEKIRAMESGVPANEARALLFAAIFLADEIDEARKAAPQPAPPPAPAPYDADDLAATLERVAAALENAATALEGRAPDA